MMNLRNLAFLAAFLFPCLILAKMPGQTPMGLEIFYKESATEKIREKIRKRFKLELTYYSKRFRSESVDLKDSSKNTDYRLLSEICRRLKDDPAISLCEVHLPGLQGVLLPLNGIQIQTYPVCLPLLTGLPFDEHLQTLQNDIEAIDPTNRCAPLPGMSEFPRGPTESTSNPNQRRYDSLRGRWTNCNVAGSSYPPDDPMHPLNDDRCENSEITPLFPQEAVGPSATTSSSGKGSAGTNRSSIPIGSTRRCCASSPSPGSSW